jgi:hypothetical protein
LDDLAAVLAGNRISGITQHVYDVEIGIGPKKRPNYEDVARRLREKDTRSSGRARKDPLFMFATVFDAKACDQSFRHERRPGARAAANDMNPFGAHLPVSHSDAT